MKALETKVAQEGLILTEEQLKALEKKKEEQQQEHGEIETEHPGYLGCQDTFYVGNLKGVGRIYQQTFQKTEVGGQMTGFLQSFIKLLLGKNCIVL